MPRSEKPGWIDWVNSAAREIILEDLEPGGFLHDKNDLEASKVWEFYKKLPEFKGPPVVFSQFELRLKDHRKQATIRHMASKREEIMMQNDRKLYPEQLHNHNGELIFARHPANKCLQEDVKAKKHMNMTPSQIHSSRSEYKVFDLKMFNRRINQEIRRAKFINYLEWKRTKKRRKFKEKEEKVQGKKQDKRKKDAKKMQERKTTEDKQKANEKEGGKKRKKEKEQDGPHKKQKTVRKEKPRTQKKQKKNQLSCKDSKQKKKSNERRESINIKAKTKTEKNKMKEGKKRKVEKEKAISSKKQKIHRMEKPTTQERPKMNQTVKKIQKIRRSPRLS
jgi:hypothetical protein